jgi:hypothetical protein
MSADWVGHFGSIARFALTGGCFIMVPMPRLSRAVNFLVDLFLGEPFLVEQ